MTGDGRVELSIVIVNYRSWEVLDRCLASLPAAEVIVVDNDSGDGRLKAFSDSHPRARVVRNDGNWGFADGCNVGAARARGDLLLFLNPDTEDPGGQVAALVAEARAHPEAAILTARQIDEGGRRQTVFDAFPSLLTLFGPLRALLRRVAPARYPDPRREHRGLIEVDWVSGSALLVRRGVFDALGGFFNGFWMYSEDVDLCRRARDAGHTVAVTFAVTLVHAHGGASRKNEDTAAITRSEVVVSRHLYASRHLGGLQAPVYHLGLVLTRFVPALVASRKVAGHLARYYRQVPSRGWRSLRAR
jgi:GT2 family glycosyltransferase